LFFAFESVADLGDVVALNDVVVELARLQDLKDLLLVLRELRAVKKGAVADDLFFDSSAFLRLLAASRRFNLAKSDVGFHVLQEVEQHGHSRIGFCSLGPWLVD
jgi:hypothetical protein